MKNLVVRSLSGIVFIIIMVGGLLWRIDSYAVIMALIIAGMMQEYMTITLGKKFPVHKALAITAGLILFVSLIRIQLYGTSPMSLLITLVPIVAIFIANLYVKEFNQHEFKADPGSVTYKARVNNGYEAFPFVITSLLYIAVPMSLTSLIVFKQGTAPVMQYASDFTNMQPVPEYSGYILLSMFIILWATDVGAYCFGSTLGQKFGKKLFPSVSPKKSWIGFWGGMLSAVIVAVILQQTALLKINIIHSVVLAIIICIFGVWGDLVESQLKRNFGVKDSGNIMPGHGGMLDRFDGALLAFPIAIIYLKIFVLN